MATEYYSTCMELEKRHRQRGNDDQATYYDDLQNQFTLDLVDLQQKLKSLNMRYQVEAASWKIEKEHKAEEVLAMNKVLKVLLVVMLIMAVGLYIFFKKTYEFKKRNSDIYDQARELKSILES